MSQKIPERLETLRKLNSSRQWVNDELYRLMFKEDLYIIAYGSNAVPDWISCN